jgi:alkylation response protein AidB-like acyl-CoA dehydrogenase
MAVRFTLTPQQRDLVDGVQRLLERHAGVGRARALGGDVPQYDHELEKALGDAGYADCARDPQAGPLEAALVTEATAGSLGVIAIGARALVAPGMGLDIPQGPMALTTVGHSGPVRFAADAGSALVADANEARLIRVRELTVEPVASKYGYPMGRISIPGGGHPTVGTSLGPGSGGRMRAWWRLAVAVELVGTMRAALEVTLAHVRDRSQFGRPIGSFQAVQHRLAETGVLVEGSRLLALEAVWLGAPEEAAAVALSHGIVAARRVFLETHQFTGAIGFATENDLHLWTMRLVPLIVEAEWMAPPAAAVAAIRWPDRSRQPA